jgi:quinol monooxygenase YgiN
MLGVFAKVTVKPELINRFWQYLEADAVGSRREPGCLRFDILRDDAASNVFYLYEVYVDKAAYAVHQQAPYFKAFFAEAGDTLAGTPEVHMTTVVSPEGVAHWPKAPG